MAFELLRRGGMATALAALPTNASSDLACLGPYKVIESIAEGGMGIVLRGQDVRDGRMVALKTVRSKRCSEATGIRREIAVLAQMSHPGIVQLIADGTCRGMPWMAMELLHGQTVCETIAALWRKPLLHLSKTSSGVRQADDTPTMRAFSQGTSSVPGIALSPVRAPASARRLSEVVRIVAQVSRALEYLHGRGLVHRDVKPANVFVGDDGRVTLLDFGLACVAPDDATELRPAEYCVGTMEYAAPEQIRGDAVDMRADVYSLGCVAYELVTGRRPADAARHGGSAGPQVHSHPAPSELVSGLPCQLETLLLAMLAKRRDDRPRSAGEIAETLEGVAGRLAS